MGKKSWTLFPGFIIFSVVMLLMSFASYSYNKTLFFIELSATAVSIAAVIIVSLRYRSYLFKTVTKTLDTMYGSNSDYLNSFPFPVVVVGRKNEIILYNDAFYDKFVESGKVMGNFIHHFLGENEIEKIVADKGCDIEYGGSKFTVYASEVERGTSLYFIDNTYFKDIEKKYNESRISVAVAVFDNKDDFYKDDDEIGDQTVLAVENVLQRWAAGYMALYKKTSDGKYLILIEERAVENNIQNKFHVLDMIREIKVDSMSATVSMGLARNCGDLRSGFLDAKKALDMALGRGGDQAALIENGNYEFFGGYSSGVEKQDKVRARIVASSLSSIIKESDSVVIMGHKYSDLDCVGSAIGMYAAISRIFKKDVHIAINSKASMAKPLVEMYSRVAPNAFVSPSSVINGVTDKSLLIIVDTHSPDFIESFELYEQFENVVVIDHHRKMVKHIDNAKVFFHEPTASSACEMCTQLISYIGADSIGRNEAQALLSGIMLDTKNFVIKTGVNTFEAAAFLRKKGADTVEVRSLFSSTIDIYKEKYKLVSNAQIINNCAISVQKDKISNVRLVAAQAADELLMLKDVMASFVVFVTNDDVVNISARSYGKINVQLVMEKLGGGGHFNMAATQLKDTDTDAALSQLINIIKDIHVTIS